MSSHMGTVVGPSVGIIQVGPSTPLFDSLPPDSHEFGRRSYLDGFQSTLQTCLSTVAGRGGPLQIYRLKCDSFYYLSIARMSKDSGKWRAVPVPREPFFFRISSRLCAPEPTSIAGCCTTQYQCAIGAANC